ncbi:hypothetical protein [Streptomyces sp. NPDC001404]|uniref:hypothetical protein n=1 Tax=Streptomyces sp. NPDC001404 TaxID=3364571 RepID=UPI003694CAB8
MTTALLPWPSPAAVHPTVVPERAGQRGRGRPPSLTSPEHIQELLDQISGGATVAEAAAALGLSRKPVYHLRRSNPLFARALTAAQEAGRKARRRAAGERLQVDRHGTESSYTKRRCTCSACRRAGTQARTRRRAAALRTVNSPTSSVA